MAVGEALEARGRCALALSRGGAALRRLAEEELHWQAVDLFQVDDRAAPDGASERNLTAILRDLCERITGPRPRVHAMPVTGDLDGGTAAYARELESVCGVPPVLDVVHLGLGPDGHTASLVPGDPVLDVRDAWVGATATYGGYRRLTLTFPVLDRARLVVFLVSGASKADALRSVLAGDGATPASRLRAARVRFLVDAAAGASLPPEIDSPL